MFESSVFLSENPFIVFVRVGMTLAHIWFDCNAIDLGEGDIASIAQEISWHSNGRIIFQPGEAYNGVFQLLIAPNYVESNPKNFQLILDYIKLILRAACPSCSDYLPDRSHLELSLEPEAGSNPDPDPVRNIT